jgi:uncharacterized protein (TIGR02646 family)
MAFRTKHPQRRNITKVVTAYNDHKADLRLDFNERCGYCDCWDKFKTTFYEIDHFIPQSILTIKPKTDYSNLVYSCKSCNNAKSNQWPTNDENICNQNNQGFIDPCHNDYAIQFERSDGGEIKWITELGKWMFFALRLHKPQHAIIWNLEQLDIMIKDIRQILEGEPDNPIKDELFRIYGLFYDYSEKLAQYK